MVVSEYCYPKPVIESEDASFTAENTAANVFSNECDDIGNYWLAQDGVDDAKFTVDLGCIVKMTGFEVRNTNNGNYRDR